MIIRRFQKKDAKQIARLYHETIRNINLRDYTEQQVKAWAPDDLNFRDWETSCAQKYVFVADHEGIIAGFAELEENGHIDCFYCHKNYQRSGIGSRLLRTLEKQALEMGLDRLYTESSITAKSFFIKMGFTVLKEQEVMTRGEWLRNFKMEKHLKRSDARY